MKLEKHLCGNRERNLVIRRSSRIAVFVHNSKATLTQFSCLVLPMLKEGNEREEFSCHLPFVAVPKGCRGEYLEAGQLGIQEETTLVLLLPLRHVSLCMSVPHLSDKIFLLYLPYRSLQWRHATFQHVLHDSFVNIEEDLKLKIYAFFWGPAH